jgi:hypothetical protein
MQAGCPLHLFKALNRHHSGQRLPLAFDDELVVAERDSIENVAEPLSDLQRGNLSVTSVPSTGAAIIVHRVAVSSAPFDASLGSPRQPTTLVKALRRSTSARWWTGP